MGKHEREAVELAERAVADVLNGKLSSLPTGKPWSNHVQPLAERILEEYPTLASARHKGNQYGDIGDLVLTLSNGESLPAELKFSESRDGTGTLANLGEDTLTVHALVTGAQSWSRWREARGFDPHVIQLLDRHPNCRPHEGKVAKGDALDKLGDPLALRIRKEVKEFATQDRLDYLNYLRSLQQDSDRIQRFAYCLMKGYHVADQLANAMANVRDHADMRGVVTFYTNVVDGQVQARFETHSRLADVLSAADSFRIQFGVPGRRVVRSRILASMNGLDCELLTFSLNWKNVFQGIQTPSINFWIGSYFRT